MPRITRRESKRKQNKALETAETHRRQLSPSQILHINITNVVMLRSVTQNRCCIVHKPGPPHHDSLQYFKLLRSNITRALTISRSHTAHSPKFGTSQLFSAAKSNLLFITLRIYHLPSSGSTRTLRYTCQKKSFALKHVNLRPSISICSAHILKKHHMCSSNSIGKKRP